MNLMSYFSFNMLNVILLILAIPTGFIISWYARDELIQGRRWFISLLIAGILVFIISFINDEYAILYSSAFISVISIISYAKSFDKRWTSK